MLSRCPSRTLPVVNRLQTRSFIDYLAYLKSKSSGVEHTTQTKKKQAAFSWDFVDYFRKQEPEKAADFEAQQKSSKDAENWLSRPSAAQGVPDFEKWRARIADPAFVDRLEEEMKATSEYWSQFTKYEQTNEWSAAGWADESIKDFSFPKLLPGEEGARLAKETQAAEVMEKHRELLEEIRLDYEQLEAERDLFATSEDMVHFALHPQLAEQQEEQFAGKQTFTDFQMRTADYAHYVKRERLAQAQNETRRQLFLERYKYYSHFNGFSHL